VSIHREFRIGSTWDILPRNFSDPKIAPPAIRVAKELPELITRHDERLVALDQLADLVEH